MTLEQRADLVLTFARTLYINGQATEQTVDAAERLGRVLGLHVTLVPRWGDLQLMVKSKDGAFATQAAGSPSSVEMERVAQTMRAIEDVASHRLAMEAARNTIESIARTPPAPIWQFVLAAAFGAVALADIFGVRHLAAAILIFVSAGAGAFLRRALGRISPNLFLQPFCAAVLAGAIGAIAVRWNLSSSLRLVAVCPCMILVPGPHLLNGALDLINGRIALGIARSAYAGLIVVAICVGLLLGLAVLGVSLPTDPPGRDIPVWEDIIAAGVAVAAYSVFFSMPLSMLPWPVAVGMAAHAFHWLALSELGLNVAAGALIACVAVALILTPVSRRKHMPFAAIGFASVVSMMPGVFLFRMASGLLQIATDPQTTFEVVRATMFDGLVAAMIILAMSFGLIIPKLVIDYVSESLASPPAR
ncbi:MAG TPA: threonine/serine exporter family protein [Acetobacteraceae bacterium]|nr:threonine/serine exporter family protein [Acetobacteraceae bacterium]